MKAYDVCIIGAGFAGLGYKMAHENVVMLEETEILGTDYMGIFRPVKRIKTPTTHEGEILFQYLQKEGILQKDGMDLPRMFPVLCHFVQDHCMDSIYLDASLITIERRNSEYIVTYRTNSGISHIMAKKVIDATARRNTARDCAKEEKRELHCYCHSEDPEAEKLLSRFHPDHNIIRDITYEKSKFRIQMETSEHLAEYIVSFTFSPQVTLSEARSAIEGAWEKEGFEKRILIDMVGFDFDYTCREIKEKEGLCWLAPHDFQDPFSAFEAGVQLEV